MNEEYLINLHQHLGITDDYKTWINAVKDNDDYLTKLHSSLDIKDDFATWKGSVMGKTKGSADATPGVEPIVTESGLDVGTLGLPESSDPNDWKNILIDINNGVTKNHVIVKSRLAKEYFNLDDFGADGMNKYYAEEENYKRYFGEDKYKQYLMWQQSGETAEGFDPNWVDSSVVAEVVSRVKTEQVEQFTQRIDDEDLKAKLKTSAEDGVFDLFGPGEGDWMKRYEEALALDRAKENRIKELGGYRSSIYGSKAEASNKEVMRLTSEKSKAQAVLGKYFESKYSSINDQSTTLNTSFGEFNQINQDFETKAGELKKEFDLLGDVDKFSSPDKIAQYNALIAKGNALKSDYQATLNKSGLSERSLMASSKALLTSLNKVRQNYGKVKDLNTIARAMVKDYSLTGNMMLQLEDIASQIAIGVNFVGEKFAWVSDRVANTLDAAIKPMGRLSEVDWSLDSEANPKGMEQWFKDGGAASINYTESLQQHKQAVLPSVIDWSDVDMDNIGAWSKRALGDNIFSIAAATSYGAAIKIGANIPLATRVLSGTFFTVEGVGKLSTMQIDQKNAPKQIMNLQGALAQATDPNERTEIIKQIDYYSKALTATEWEKAFSSTLYGGIAMYAERLGTMRIMRGLMTAAPTTGRLTLANTIKGAGAIGLNTGIEYVEEFGTQVGHNLVDMLVLDQKKSLLHGVDANFNANIIFSTLAIQGPSTSMNIVNTLRSEVNTQIEISKNRERAAKLFEINQQLQDPTLVNQMDQGYYDFLVSESNALIREAALEDSYNFAEVANMSATELHAMFDLNQKKRDELNKMQNLGASSVTSGNKKYIEKQKKKIINNVDQLDRKRSELRGKPSERRRFDLEEFLGKGKVQAETEFFYGKYQGAKNIVKGLAGKVKEFGKINEDGTLDLTDLGKYLDKKLDNGQITKKQRKDYMNGFASGNFASFVGNEVILVDANIMTAINNAETNLEKSIAAYAPLHELQHINDISTGLVKDLDVVTSQQGVVAGIETQIEDLYKQGKIKEKNYKVIKDRIAGYKKDNNGQVDLMELLTIAGELKDAGILNQNSIDPLLSMKLMLNQFSNKYFKKGDMFFKLKSTDDVLRYIDSFQRSTKNSSLILGPEEEVKKPKFSKNQTNAINELAEMGWTNATWRAQGADFAIKEMQSNKMLDGLIRSKYKADIVPDNFVDLVYSELVSHVKNFKPEQNDNLFGWINSQIANKAGNVYNREFKVADEMKGAKDIGKTTKEGDVKVQVAAETDSRMEALETEDLSPAAQAKKKADKAKGKQRVESEFRREIGIETGSELYNKVLESARKALLRAYEVGTSARNIQRKLRDEANVYLFKAVKNFLGTNDYVKNLKKFREPIVKAIFTADLVQLERNVPDNERIFTTFVKKLTSKQEVEDAVNQKLLPPSALNIIDKGTAVSLYKKKTPTEKQFLDFFYAPLINPVTGSRSGLRGTRKDGLAKAMAGALSYDATMEVAQESEVVAKRVAIAEINDTQILNDDIQTLAAAIGRDPSVKFSQKTLTIEQIKQNPKTKKLYNSSQRGIRAYSVVEDIFYNNKLDFYQKLTTEQKNKYGGAKMVNIAIDEFLNRPIERLDGSIMVSILRKSKKKDIPVSTAYEQHFIATANKAIKSVANKKIKVNVIVREGGIPDVHFHYNGSTIGLEIKMDTARGVSSTWRFDTRNYTVKNPKETNKQKELIDKFEKVASNSVFEGIDFAKGVTKEQFDTLKKHKHLFNKSVDVTAEYLIWQYTSKVMPEYFINIGQAGTFYMLGENAVVNAQILTIANKLGIPKLQGNFKLYSRLSVGSRYRGKDYGYTKATTIRTDVQIDTKSKENFPNGFSDVNLVRTKDMNDFVKEVNKSLVNINEIKGVQNQKKAVGFSRLTNNPAKGITVLDFDDTLATSKSLIRFTRPDGTKGTLNAEQYASTYEELSDLGYKFDFSEFSKVVKGKTAPLFNKAMKLQGKFGPENMFVLTARPADSAPAIFEFLKANGLNIPLKNITGLANSTSEAKALWMAEKVGEGYNDFYFADDALQNVQAVKNMLDQFDVKSKVQQAKVKFSKGMNKQFNDILENITGIESKKRFSIIKGRKRGDSKGKFRFFIPPSHEDFVGLLYNFMGKGKEGNKHRDFFEEALVRPLNRGYREIDTAKQAIANDHKSLNKQFPEVKDKLVKNTPDGDFTFQDAIRVYLWDKHGHKIPGLTETDQKKLAELVMSDSQLQAYAETLNIISKQENYVAPGQAWETANIRIDLVDATGRVGRADYFAEFNENAEVIFSEENLNKIEAAYGRSAREAIEDMLHRIKTGVNRPKGTNGKPNMFMNWLNASVSGVMFFNTRSALLQQMSNVNFLNFADNNIFKAGLAFANQPQYWKDFAMIFNSDMLKQRRGGLGTDINGAELADAIKKARPDNMFDQVSIIVGKALKLGFLPTQIGDNIAIATGGAAFYRNRVNKLIKDGMSRKEAEATAFTDLQNITQSTQQSARPDMTSQQQASWIGKLVLNFLNTPSQYNRIIKKAGLDIKNRRITPPNTTQMQSDMSNLSRILYYGAAQNLIFYSLQTALFAVMFDDDDDESEAFLKKKERVINGSIDTILRGSGIYGVGISTLKNMMIKFLEQREKGYNKDESAVIMEMLNFSPVVGIKARKVVNAEKTLNYNKDIISEMETFDIDNPQWSAVTNYVEAITTAPVNRLYQKTINLRNAADNEYTAFQRALFFSGYTTWSLDLGDTEKMKNIKSDIKEKKKKSKKKKKPLTREGIRRKNLLKSTR